jgi:hypothetical protein
MRRLAENGFVICCKRLRPAENSYKHAQFLHSQPWVETHISAKEPHWILLFFHTDDLSAKTQPAQPQSTFPIRSFSFRQEAGTPRPISLHPFP